MPSLTCIIPAFNEEPRIAVVLRAVLGVPAVGKVIVVDDCSGDRTADIAASFAGVEVIRQPTNQGKTRAVASGIRASQSDFLLLLDADLEGLSPAAIEALIAPVLNGTSRMSMSLRRNALLIYRYILGIDFISGERVIPRSLLASHLEELARLQPFALEVYMNGLIITERLPISIVYWPGVRSPKKPEKLGLWKGVIEHIRMHVEILKTISLFQAFRQIAAMRRLARWVDRPRLFRS